MIAIVSDIHDNQVNLDKFINYINKNKIKQVICAGDITNDETINHFSKKFKGTIHLVKGNADFYNEDAIKKIENIRYYGEQGKLKINKKDIAFTHFPYIADKLAKSNKYNYIFFGHTHKPSEKKINNTTILNPGTLAGMFGMSTFALWDDNKIFKLIITDDL